MKVITLGPSFHNAERKFSSHNVFVCCDKCGAIIVDEKDLRELHELWHLKDLYVE